MANYLGINQSYFDSDSDSIDDSRGEIKNMAYNFGFFDISGIANGQLLSYNSSTGNMEPTNAPTGSLETFYSQTNTTGNPTLDRSNGGTQLIDFTASADRTLPVPTNMSTGEQLKLITKNSGSTMTLSVTSYINGNSGGFLLTTGTYAQFNITKIDTSDYIIAVIENTMS